MAESRGGVFTPEIRWPYDFQAAEQRLQLKDIIGQGEFFLKRALNIDRTVAFVGSGVSAAYGRVSWAELATLQIEGIAEAFDPLFEARPDDSEFKRVKGFVDLLKSFQPRVRDEDGDTITQAMQIAEQVWAMADPRLLRALLNRFSFERRAGEAVEHKTEGSKTEKQKAGDRLAGEQTTEQRTTEHQTGERQTTERQTTERQTTEQQSGDGVPLDGAKRFRKLIMEETHDVTMHVKRILSWTFTNNKGDSINEFLKQIRPPELGRFRADGTTSQLHRIFSRTPERDELIPSIKRVAKETRKFLEANRVGPSPDALYLSRLSAAECALKAANLLAELQAASGMISPMHYYAVGLAIDLLRFAAAGKQPEGLKTIQQALEKNFKSDDPARRQNIIPPSDDPLLIVQSGLKIKRFVTTNYDLEIERLFEHLGFGRTHYSAQDELPEDEVERVGNLGTRSREIVLQDKSGADFIDFVSGNGPYYAQVLHIHGRATKDDDVVITERDYQRAYVGEEPRHVTAREGFEILFGGNPVVFLGLGLSEGDVMRPLREFAADNIRRNTSVVALKPATDAEAKRNAFMLGQYVRHRLYVLHYGIETDEKGEAVRRVDSNREPIDPSWLAPLSEYVDSLSNMIKYLTTDHSEQSQRKIDILGLGDAIDKKLKRLPDSLRGASFNSDGDRQCTVAFELGLLRIIADLLNGLAGIDSANLLKEHYCKGILEILRRAVTRTKNAILTRALTARLRGIEAQWQGWSGSWFDAPEERLTDRWDNTGRITPTLPYDADILNRSKNKELRELISKLYQARWYRQVFAEPTSITDVVKKVAQGGIKDIIDQTKLPLAAVRRLFVVTGVRGEGKGAAFSDLTRYGDFLLDRTRFDQPDPLQRIPERRYAAQFSATFSFSSEIASVWDTLTAFLQAPLEKSKVTMENWRHDGLGRIGRLRLALKHANDRVVAVKAALDEAKKNQQETSFEVEPRFLVILHAIDLLFREGEPKTAEIAEIFRCILDAKECNIDWVLICGSRHIPALIKKTERRYHSKLKSWRKDPDGSGNAAELPDGRFLATLYSLVREDREALGREIEKFERDIDQSIHARGNQSADEIIHRILTYWRERSVPSGRHEAEKKRIWESLGGAVPLPPWFVDLDAAEDFSLQEVIIRHLAVISVPVDARVLARSNEVRRRARAALNYPTNETSDGIQTQERWDTVVKVIELALAVLCSRGLAFRFFTPYEKREREAGAERALIQRYQVHRLVQLYIYRRLGSQNLEPANAFFFSVSLYAAQARDLPTLSANSYAFLSDLVDQLIDYPSRDGKTIHYPFDFTDAARCLRAALGIVRTLFSIGVVARFAELGEVTIPHPPRVGYFEHRRLVLRWMIMRAAALDRQKQELAKQAELSGQPTAPDDDPMPFYRDEIAWLYNECGVFSLSQGQCFDAHGLLRFAQKKAREIEGRKRRKIGPIGRRILTNLGACEINRGRLPRARQMFERVERDERDDKTISLIARGYLALICHVEGAIGDAQKQYGEAISGLRKIGRMRAPGLFLCFRAELFRHLNDPSHAERDLEEALDFARRAGYEDMARFAVVGIARLRASNAQTKDVPSIIRSLEEAEKYADAMDIALLRCEISYTRAIILLKQGEHTRAGREATRAIRTATLSGLALRALAYRNLLADVHLSRGWSDQGKRMKEQIREEARNIGYRLLLQRMSKTAELPRRSATDLSRSPVQGATGS